MDIFLEQIVKHKKSAVDYVKIVLMTVLAVILIAIGFVANFIYGRYLFGLGYLVIAAICYGYYLLIGMFNVEYEYILTNDEMDIDKIVAKKGRKHVTEINFREIELCARVNDSEYSAEANNTDGFVSIIDASGNKNDDNVYFVDYHTDSGKCRVYFQPTEKIIDAVYKFNPRKIHK